MGKTISRVAAGALGLLAALTLSPGSSHANKANDTLNMAVTDWWSTMDPFQFPLDEAAVFYKTIYETLVAYDERKHVFVPRLAKAWRRIDDKTMEFDIRDDVMFHNGNHMDADDAVATFNYARDPNTPMRFKDRYDWVADIQKTGPYQIRIVAKKPSATDLETIAYRFYVFDSRVLAKLDNKADYGRVSGVGTGPYKMVSLDAQKMVLQRFDAYYEKSGNFRAPIKNVIVTPIPDRQTQIAQFITGNVDLIRNVTADTARELVKMPDARITDKHNGMLMYVTLDAMGRSDNKAMKDQRVRKAFMMAVNRQELAKTVIPGGENADILDGICVPADVGCASSTKPVGFDLEGAKKLMSEAGYANGFDMEFDVHESIKEIGEAVAGMVRRIGIRASVRPLPLALYVRLRGEGKFTAFNGFYPTNAQPDMDNIFDFFFDGNRDYWNDPVIQAAQKAGVQTPDEEKRALAYQKGVDQVNNMNYILPLADLPMVFVHTKDVKVDDNPLSPIDTRVGDFFWTN